MAKMDIATFGGGCFWCLEAIFQRHEGVNRVESGYAGGQVPNPTYQQVCTGATGHAEVVRVHFDSEKTHYADILNLFFRAHDPTTLNRQGADVGTQYRSIILYQNEEQRQVAEQAKKDAAALYTNPVVTEISSLDIFYEAEPHHQDYYRTNSQAPYCRVVIKPKLQKLNML